MSARETGGTFVPQCDELTAALDHALVAHEPNQAHELIDALAATAPTARQSTDACERCAARGDAALLKHALVALDPPYLGRAYALALRHANEPCARLFMARGHDLLEDPPDRMPTDEFATHSLARHDLTRSSAGLLRDLSAASVASIVFGPRATTDSLVGPPLADTATVARSTELTLDLMQDGAFDSVVVDDLFRAALAEADACLRIPAISEPTDVETLLAFCSGVALLHRTVGFGSRYLDLIAGSLFRPQARFELLAFVAEAMPEVFLERLAHLSWLRNDPALVVRIASHLGEEARGHGHLGELVSILATAGATDQIARIVSWTGAVDADALVAAVDAAVASRHAETALELMRSRADLDAEDPLKGLRL